MDALAVALVLAGSLHADYGDGTDVAALVLLERLGFGLDQVELVLGQTQRIFPMRVGQRRHSDRQFDHLFRFERGAVDIYEQVADAAVGGGGEFDHHAWV